MNSSLHKGGVGAGIKLWEVMDASKGEIEEEFSLKKSSDLKKSQKKGESTAGAQGEGGPTSISVLKVHLDYGMEGPFEFTVSWEYTMEGKKKKKSWEKKKKFFFFL